jgi:Tol biopolymer transport system component
MAAGSLPFNGNTAAVIFNAILSQTPIPPSRLNPDLPLKLEEIVHKLLEKDRGVRYQSAKELLVDLKRLKRDTDSARVATAILEKRDRSKAWKLSGAVLAIMAAVLLLVGVSTRWRLTKPVASRPSPERELRRLTFDSGLQDNPTWSPDGRYIAYASDRGGNFDIWVQQVSGGNPNQVTKSAAHDWQPDWSPQGDQIVFRSERSGGGLFVVPALGGPERRVSDFGYKPRWSPDSSKVLFTSSPLYGPNVRIYVTSIGGKPVEVLREFLAKEFQVLLSLAWHPDGKRISVLVFQESESAGFWTIPLTSGTPIRSELNPVHKKHLFGMGGFTWAASGKALYFEGDATGGVVNLWKVQIEPEGLRWLGEPERLTNSTGTDLNPSVSQDGKLLAFSACSIRGRTLSIPFDPGRGKIVGTPVPLRSDLSSPLLDLSFDGTKLAFCPFRDLKQEIWVRSFVDNSETPLLATDEFRRQFPRWSRDGKFLAYQRFVPFGDSCLIILPSDGGEEQTLTSPSKSMDMVCDWTLDGKWILASHNPGDGGHNSLVLLPIAGAPHAETSLQELISHPNYDLFDGRFSADGHWICFAATTRPEKSGFATIYTVSSAGGKWNRITEGMALERHPRWAPDGKTIYFVSDRTKFFNVWGIRIDPAHGGSIGQPFQVTTFDNPAKWMASNASFPNEISVGKNRLVWSLAELSGNIWMLDNVDH